MGAHEAAPSLIVVDGVEHRLDDWIAESPNRALGRLVTERFGARLPFLLKILAPARALSIQCHPSATQAESAPPGTYADSWPKPEALLALTEFEIFVGLRPLADVKNDALELGVWQLVDMLSAADDAFAALRAFLSLGGDKQAQLADCVTAALSVTLKPHLAAIRRAAASYPSDSGIVVLLFMRHHLLPAGAFAYMPTGTLHAYVQGLAVEVLANSDNVARAGLTHKALDVGELLRIIGPDHQADILLPDSDQERLVEYSGYSEYFELARILGGPCSAVLDSCDGPRIGIAVGGGVEVRVGRDSLKLASLEACFIPPSGEGIDVSGAGALYIAGVGQV